MPHILLTNHGRVNRYDLNMIPFWQLIINFNFILCLTISFEIIYSIQWVCVTVQAFNIKGIQHLETGVLRNNSIISTITLFIIHYTIYYTGAIMLLININIINRPCANRVPAQKATPKPESTIITKQQNVTSHLSQTSNPVSVIQYSSSCRPTVLTTSLISCCYISSSNQ